MKIKTIFRRIVKAAVCLEHVIPEVGKAGVQRHTMTQLDKFSVQRFQQLFVVESSLGDFVIDFFSYVAISVQ